MNMPRRPTPTPREMRRLEDAAAPELAAGVREVERGREIAPDEPYVLACNRCNVERLPEVHPCPACRCPEYRILPVAVEEPRSMTHAYDNTQLQTEPAPGLPDYLVRIVEADMDYTNSCDYGGCFAPEYEDILNGTSDELRPIYLDTRYEVRICQRCVEAGKHLTDDGGPRPCP